MRFSIPLFAILAALILHGPAHAGERTTADMLKIRVMGDPKAPITVTEYASLTCSHCATFHREFLPAIKADFIDTGKVKLEYVDYAFGDVDSFAMMLTRCAPEKRYFKLLSNLYKNQKEWSKGSDWFTKLSGYVILAGLPKPAIEACVANKEMLTEIQRRTKEAEVLYGIKGTPGFVIDGTHYEGGYDKLHDFLAELTSK